MFRSVPAFVEDYVRVYPDGSVFTSEGEPQAAASRDRQNFLNHRKFYRFAAQFVRGRTVLDAGCGTGYGCEMLAAAGAAAVTGIDLSRHALAYARRFYGGTARFLRDDAAALHAIPDASCDVVVSSEVLEHLKPFGKEGAMLDAALRVLHPGGLLVLATPNSELLGRHGFSFDELEALLVPRFRQYLVIENALIRRDRSLALWKERVDAGRTGLVVEQNIRLAETFDGEDPALLVKSGVPAGIIDFSGWAVDTRLLHNTHSWIVLGTAS